MIISRHPHGKAWTQDGKVHVYDLYFNRYKPLCVQRIIPRSPQIFFTFSHLRVIVWCVCIYVRVCIYVLCVFMCVMCVFICVYLYASMCVFSLLMCNHHEEYEGKWSGDKDDSTTSPSTPHIQSSLSATASGGWVTSGIKYLKWTFLYLSRCIHSSCHRI